MNVASDRRAAADAAGAIGVQHKHGRSFVEKFARRKRGFVAQGIDGLHRDVVCAGQESRDGDSPIGGRSGDAEGGRAGIGPYGREVSGIDIGTGQQWVFAATKANAALNHYTFLVTYKSLVILPGAINVNNFEKK